ncbi:MAG: transposase [Rhizonema sp. NSF051]|nr:transposase [Rhizonema sp. NSF051]
MDSQSAKLAGESTLSGRLCVKSAAMVSQSVGFDAGKKIKGRKRFLTVDTLGLVLRVLVTSASMGEREGGKQVLQRVKQYPHQTSRLTTLWVDGGNDYEPFMQWVMNFCRCPSAGGITPTTLPRATPVLKKR